MKVILLKSLKGRGNEGDIIEVKSGYGRNYLIPQGFALQANNNNFRRIEEIKRTKSKIIEKEKGSFLQLKTEIENISLTIAVEAKEDEELYGSINEAHLLKCLKNEGLELPKDKLVMQEPIKKLGVYNLKVNLHPEIEASLRVWVVKK